MAGKLKVGAKAPAFELKNQDGNVTSLSDFKGRKVLVYFYPKASTPGCTTQSCAVSESLSAQGLAGGRAWNGKRDEAN